MNLFLYDKDHCHEKVKEIVVILVVSEKKLDSTFPANKFTTENYAAPIKFKWNDREGNPVTGRNCS